MLKYCLTLMNVKKINSTTQPAPDIPVTVRSQAHPHRRLPSIQWFIHPQGEPSLTQQTSLRIGNGSPTTLKSHTALKHERQGLCHHCFTQLIAWLWWITPAAICPMAEASKTFLVLRLTVQHRPKGAQCHTHLPRPSWNMWKGNYIV